MIGLELGVVPRFGKFQFPPERTLADILPELRSRWELGDLRVEFRLMDLNGLYSHVPMTKCIGEIDHGECSLMLRESDRPALGGNMGASMVASIARPVGAPGAPIALVDDPEPTEPDATRILFRIEQRNNAAVRLTFSNKATFGEVKQRIARILDIGLDRITLLFSGKTLQDKFFVGRLHVGVNHGIIVYIKDETETLLLTGTGRRRS
jgi:hypothetical protein